AHLPVHARLLRALAPGAGLGTTPVPRRAQALARGSRGACPALAGGRAQGTHPAPTRWRHGPQLLDAARPAGHADQEPTPPPRRHSQLREAGRTHTAAASGSRTPRPTPDAVASSRTHNPSSAELGPAQELRISTLHEPCLGTERPLLYAGL